MIFKKILPLLSLLMVGVGNIGAQRYFVTNEYVYDLYLVNPAAAAIKSDCYSINGYFQKQWAGTDLAPTMQMLSFQKAFQSNLGSGTYVYNDRNGFHREIGAQQTLAYEILLTKNRRRVTNLLFGMSLMASQRSLDVSNFGDRGADDPVITGGSQSGFGFNANAGLMLTVNNWQFGLSATNLFPGTNTMYSEEEEPKTPLDLNFVAGTIYKVADRNLYVEPLFFYRRNNYVDSRIDLNLKFTMPTVDPSFAWWGVLAYRRSTDESVGDNLGVAATLGIIKGGFMVGLEYQLGLTTAQIDYGSRYQLVAAYRICRDRKGEAIPCSKDHKKVGK